MTFTLLELRQDIETILTTEDYLGQYIWADGETTNAIAVLPDDNYGLNFPPEEVSVNKIEVVIIKPEIKNKPLLGGDVFRRHRYQLFLKQWEKRDENGLLVYPPRLRKATQDLYEHLSHKLYDLTNPTYVPRNEKIGIIESSTFDVYCFDACIA